jgi:MFS family permease
MTPYLYFRRALRWLIRADAPVPARSEAELAAYMTRHYRWNFAANMLDGATFWFGLSFISSATIVPLFVSKLTDSTLALGLAAMIAQGSWMLPQLFTANAVERLARKKPVVVNLGLFLERLPLLTIVLAAVIAGRNPALALIIFLLSYAWHGLGAGVVATAWQDLLASCFPVDRRGRMLGLTMFLGAGAGALGAQLSSRLLERYPFPTNFIVLFAIAAFGINLSWLFLALVREPARAVTAPRQSSRAYFRNLGQILRQDHNFRRFLLGRLLLVVSGMGTGFLTVSAIDRWGVADSAAGLYTMLLLIGQTIGNITFGLLADRYGHKLSLELCGLTALAAFGLAWLAPGPVWFYAVFLLLGITQGATIVSGILVVLEFCPPGRRPTYTGLANTASGIVGLSAPLVGAGLAGQGYGWLFGGSAIAGLLAFIVLRWAVREPRWESQGFGRAAVAAPGQIGGDGQQAVQLGDVAGGDETGEATAIEHR